MKKRLEADLISIAHRILQLKNKSDINQLYLETQKLYEKLAVLRFIDAQFGEVKPTIGQAEIEKQIEEAFDTIQETPTVNTIPEVVEAIIETPQIDTIAQPEIETIVEESIETPTEKETITAEDLSFVPAFELTEEETEPETPKKQEAVQISFEDLLGGNYNDTQFVKVHSLENIPTAIAIDLEEKELIPVPEVVQEELIEPKSISLNEKLAKGIQIDLNDRIAFTKQLFGNSSEDYNRVLNQLITFDTFEETKDFIEEMVKPDYNNWEGKEEYAQRFMEIIEKKFS
jgi:hypothetical protein